MTFLASGAFAGSMGSRRAFFLLLVALAACSPALDWRELRPAGTALQLQLPCRPASHERSLALAGTPVQLALYACNAGGQTWGLAAANLQDPARVGPALDELRRSGMANIGASAGSPLPLQVSGATPNERSGRLALAGRLPDGQAVQMQLAVFTHGTQVFQATVLGPALPADATDNFFAALRFKP
jgi:hypothetical protein